ncbi:MAG: DeoR/GlpR family DNA-binding transcription regulator [Anaerostipes sp.]|nr:DeoR/GlpR family DNA-binding transcription regulator [Anaerostipes sp.]
MFAKERQEKIIELLKKNKRVSNQELIQMFGVSGTTIRIDLTELEEQGLISRTHGGALLKHDPVYGEDEISSRREKNQELKIQIAKKALELIEDGDTLLLDSGTTMLELAKMLHQRKRLTVITNDLQVALELQKDTQIQLILIGGRVRNSFECTVGAMGIRFLEDLSVDKAFITTNALSLKKGATTPNSDNAEIKREMMEIANKRYLLCDSSKVGQRTVCSFARINSFDLLIIDDEISGDMKEQMEEIGGNIY